MKLDFTAEDKTCKIEDCCDEDHDVFVEEENQPRIKQFIELNEEDLTDNEVPVNEVRMLHLMFVWRLLSTSPPWPLSSPSQYDKALGTRLGFYSFPRALFQ